MRWLLCLPLAACASNAEIADRYKDAIAIEYHCLDPQPEAVQKALQAADAVCVKRVNDKLAAKDEEGAFAAALARVDLWTAARACGAPALALNTMWQQALEQRSRAIKATLAKWDAAQLDGSRTPKQQWQAIERAREWQENDPDLAARAESLRAKLQKSVRVVGNCPQCKPLVDAVMAAIAARRSQLIKLTNEADATLTLTLDVDAKLEALPWHEIKKSESSTSVTVYNRFNEPEKDSEGKTVTKKVSVKYFVDEESSRAYVKATAMLQGDKTPQSLSNEKRDQKRRFRWNGDERALPSEARDPGTAVTPAEALFQQIIDDFAPQIAAQVVKKAEDM